MDRYLVGRAEAGKAPLTLHHDAVCAKAFFQLTALRRHIKDYLQFAHAVTCGSKPEAQHCPKHIHCPMASPTQCLLGGPTADDPVNLATGEEEYTPKPDLVVYNPIGPSVSWSRIYNSLRAPVAFPDQNPVDYGVGWSYSYNLHIEVLPGYNPPKFIQVTFPNGSVVKRGINPSNAILNSGGIPFIADAYNSLLMPDRSRWIFGALNNSTYLYLVQIKDRNGHAIHFNYSNSDSLYSITDDNGKALLTINGAQSVSDCYGRMVAYQLGTFGPYSYPELTNVSQVVPSTASYPFPARYVYNYANVPSGDAAETVPFLHKITVPSPTGVGTSTATIWYLNQPNDGVDTNPNYSTAPNSGPYVSAIVDSHGTTGANGNKTLITPLSGVNQSRVQVVDSSGKVLATSLYSFDTQMQTTAQTDYNQQTILTFLHNDPNDLYEPSSITDGNGKRWSYTWDQLGHLLTETPPYDATRTPATTTYTYDETYFVLGELTEIQVDGKKATTIAYDHHHGYQEFNGPFYPSGYVQSITGPQPGQTGFSNPASVSSGFTFDGYGNLTSLTTPGNNATIVGGTDQGITTTFGYTTDGTYSQPEAIGQPLTATDNLLHVTHFRYDTLGRLASVTDALGNRTSYGDGGSPPLNGYNLADQPLRVTLPATGQTGSGQGYTTYSYQYTGGPLAAMTVYDESGHAIRQVSYGYGPEGEPLAVSGSTEPVQYTYDGLYRLSALADGNGHTTQYYYNAAGYLDSVTYPGYIGPAFPNISGPDSIHYPSYDLEGNVLQRVDGNGVVTNYRYTDPENLLTDIQYPAGGTGNVHYAYDIYDRVSQMTDGSGSITYGPNSTPGYDDLDNPLNVQTAYTSLPAQSIGYGYFNDGSRKTMTLPGRTYAYSYDKAGHFTALSNQLGESAAWGYQANDWLQSQTDSNGLQAYSTYNALGQLTDLKNTVGTTTLSEFGSPTQSSGILHDGVGNVTAVPVREPNTLLGGTTAYQYDYGQTAAPAANRSQITQEATTRNNNAGLPSAYAYDTVGNPTVLRGVGNPASSPDNQFTGSISDGNGNSLSRLGMPLGCDPENRLTTAGSAAAAVPMSLATGGDGLMRLLWRNADNSIKLSLVTSGGAVSAGYPFGPFPGWTATSLAVGPNTNSPTRILWTQTDGTISLWSVDSSGTRTILPSFGPFPGWTAVAIAVGPDESLHILWTHAGDNSVSVWTVPPDGSHTIWPTYGLNPGWQAVGITVDAASQVHLLCSNTNGQAMVWNFNAGGSLVSTPVYGPFPGWTARFIASGPASDPRLHVQWTQSGGLLSLWIINADGSHSTSPTYGPFASWMPANLSIGPDDEGHVLWGNVSGLASIWNISPGNTQDTVLPTLSSGAIAGTGATFGYRGDGLRAWKQNSAGAKTYYLYDGSDPVAELGSSGTVTATNTFGANGLVSRNTPATGTVFYAFDERGNVAHRMSSTGAVLSSDLYDAYGKQLAGASDVYGYGAQAGYRTDPETGLLLLTHRYYDPQTGRFLTRDPMGYDGGINLYGYVGNNPGNGVDPDGYSLGPPVNMPTKNKPPAWLQFLHDLVQAALNPTPPIGIGPIGTVPPKYPTDYSTKNTKDWSGEFNSEDEARNFARQKLGKSPVEIEPNKWRSQDGKWQYRAKPDDLNKGHVHLEELDPKTGEVKQNLHCRWKPGTGREGR